MRGGVCRLDPKISRREIFKRIFALGRAKDLSAPRCLKICEEEIKQTLQSVRNTYELRDGTVTKQFFENYI